VSFDPQPDVHPPLPNEVEPARDFLFVQSATEVGGAETVLLNLFEASAELRRRSLVASLGFGDGDVPDRLRRMGVEVVAFPKARLRWPLRTARTIWQIAALARRRRVRALIGNGAHPQVFAGLAARLAGASAVFFVHMIHHHPLWRNPALDVLALGGPCDLILANSQASLDAMRKLRPAVAHVLLRLGTPFRHVSSARVAETRASLGVGPQDLLVAVFGRLQRWKGQDVFVEAAARLLPFRPRLRFAIVGGSVFGLEPDFLAALERRIAVAGFGDRMRLTGFRTDVPALMAACDIICHTSRRPEPFGMVVIEAMALGRAVIATEGGGPSEIILPGETGLLVPPDHPEALAAAIRALSDDPALRDRLGANAADRARTHFHIDACAQTLIDALDQVAGRR
jgi:glycosyltransferase involved in cell wall biosynthesis